MSPATPLGLALGLDVGLEADLVRMPPNFWSALESLGAATSESSNSGLPYARLQLQKGLSPWSTLGFGFMNLLGVQNYAANLTLTPSLPEEGLLFAGRLSFSWAQIQTISTRTWSFDLLTSRRLDVAEPYLGLGVIYITGTATASTDVAGIGSVSITSTAEAVTGHVFGGIQYLLRPLGIQLTLEGDYSIAGGSSLGTKVGFSL
jgi:hypothetical protein